MGASLAEYLHYENNMHEMQKLKIMIDQHANELKGGYNGYNDHFNFGLNTATWRLFVNKQILMRYERLFIERQVHDVKNEKLKLANELQDVMKKIEDVKREQEEVKKRIKGGETSSSSGGNIGSNIKQVNNGRSGGYRPAVPASRQHGSGHH